VSLTQLLLFRNQLLSASPHEAPARLAVDDWTISYRISMIGTDHRDPQARMRPRADALKSDERNEQRS
jgi:hypothetical protein